MRRFVHDIQIRLTTGKIYTIEKGTIQLVADVTNGTKVAFEELKVVCPLAPGRHSLDDVHEVLIQIRSGMERLNETQKEIETDMKDRSQRLCNILGALRLELARREA